MGDLTMQERETGRKHSFQVLLPRRLRYHTQVELNLMRISLLNTIVALNVHLSRIEKEMRKRGIAPLSIGTPLKEKEIKQILSAELPPKSRHHQLPPEIKQEI